jgi:hypothetical protein
MTLSALLEADAALHVAGQLYMLDSFAVRVCVRGGGGYSR